MPPFLRELFTEYDNEVAPFQYLFARVGVRYLVSRGDASIALDDSNQVQEIRGIIEITPRELFFDHYLLRGATAWGCGGQAFRGRAVSSIGGTVRVFGLSARSSSRKTFVDAVHRNGAIL